MRITLINLHYDIKLYINKYLLCPKLFGFYFILSCSKIKSYLKSQTLLFY